ncbi:hypothetical protein N1851_029011 [Merluccius polli]|uniref:Ig-like domain-containing protein n=1 Tax=Merluccius polli TaxID=89951 RepID=A0AA47M7T7_MERPO|nr:hypothetical protein N1851_029011 [Merluccius polli]
MEFLLRTMLLLSLGPLLALESNTTFNLVVHQPTDVEVVEGNSAVISCCWKANITNSCMVVWSKEGAELKNISCDAARSSPNTDHICANLTLPNVTRNDSGRYVCKVTADIPSLMHFKGNGTMVTVTERQNRFNDTMEKNSAEDAPPVLSVVVSLAVVMAAIVVVALICLWKLRRRRELDQAVRVIDEVSHRDSEVDGTSTSSSQGSSQWCQVAVYESFDYFERVVKSKGKSNTTFNLVVHQPTDVEVVEGNSAVISCCWKANISNSMVVWSKDGAELKNISCDAARSSPNTDCICANLTLPNVTRNDSGRYVCEVTIDIPCLKKIKGNGTMVTVTERQNRFNDTMEKNSAEDAPPPVLSVVVSLAVVMAAIVVVALICLWKLRRRRELGQAVRVIYEVSHRDSEVDGTSTSSSQGSSQWCQVPVYESFDYFERVVESKGSG